MNKSEAIKQADTILEMAGVPTFTDVRNQLQELFFEKIVKGVEAGGVLIGKDAGRYEQIWQTLKESL